MKKVLFVLVAVEVILHAENYRSFTAASGKYGDVTLPASAPFTSVAELRIEFRIHDWTGTGRIVGLGAGNILINKNASDIGATNFYDAGSPTILATLPAGATDVLVRVQRSVATDKYTIELWRANGSEYVFGNIDVLSAGAANISGDIDFAHTGGGAGGVAGQVAWLRVYSTVVAIDSAPPSNVAGGNLLDYEFEGGGTDDSGNVQNLTMTGSPAYANSTVAPLLEESRVVRAGASFTLDCGPTAASTYFWQQLAGPLTVTFSSRTAAAPTITGADVFGQYTFQCQATNATSGVVGLTSRIVGVVSTNASGVVIPSTTALDYALGSMLREDVGPWAWYDRHRLKLGEHWATATVDYTNNFTGTEHENYYDSGLVQYQNYYRTGRTRHLTLARAIADKYFDQYYQPNVAGGCGLTNWLAPRQSSFVSLAIRANETGSSTWWTCLTDYANYHLDLWVEQRGTDNSYTTMYFGAREGGYSLINALAIAALHPTEATRNSYAARVSTEMTNYLRGLQCLAGDARTECKANYTTGAGTITATNASATVAGVGTSFSTFFTAGQRLAFLQKTTDINYHLAIASIESNTSMTLSANYTGATWTTASAEYAKDTQDNIRVGGYRWNDEGTDVAGHAEQPWIAAIAIEAAARAYRQGVAPTVADDVVIDWAQYTLDQPRAYLTAACAFGDPVPNKNFTPYLIFNILADYGTGCVDAQGLYDSRAQNNTVAHVLGMAYRLTGTTAFLTRGDQMFGATFGYHSGASSDWWKGLGDTTSGTPGKQYGQSYRSSGWYLADRLGSAAVPAPVLQTRRVGGLISSVPNATQLRVVLTYPSGASTTTTSATSPVSVSVDAQQGAHRMVVEYLSAGNAVLARSDPVVVQ